MKKICCVNDMPGVGKIALSAMIPILSARGIDVASLPTALVSNTLDFGKFDILDTTNIWKRPLIFGRLLVFGLIVLPRVLWSALNRLTLWSA